MSSSAFRHHFHQLASMSPLQYQKWLRLNEARRLMLNEKLDAADAAFNVGYESQSQFRREYSPLFGAPPKRDIEGLTRKADVKEASREALAAWPNNTFFIFNVGSPCGFFLVRTS
jgi:AraC-like DNA-binding protein